MPKVSVIIPTYNRVQTLERAFKSVLAQSECDWELLIIDDGSTDGTADFVRQWLEQHPDKHTNADRIRFFSTTTNRGVSAARNFGVTRARAPWIAFLDSDDEWLPDKLEKQLALTPHFSLIHGEEIWIRRGVRVNAMDKHKKSGGRIFKRCVDLCCVSTTTVMVNREVFLAHRGFREDFPVCEDYELWLRWSANHEVGFIETPVVLKYGGHADQLSLMYRGMDYYRVKALAPFLNTSEFVENLGTEERQHVASTLLKKCEILIKGFHKHGNLNRLAEVEKYRTLALNFLTQNRSSVGARFPGKDWADAETATTANANATDGL